MNARRTGSATAVALAGLAVALGLAQALAPRWVARSGLDVWNLDALRGEVRQAEAKSAGLNAVRDRLSREVEYADGLAARLIDGSLTLAEAVEGLEPVLRGRAGFETDWREQYRAPTLRRGVARYAIRKVEYLAGGRPGFAVLKARLEAEYAALRE
jgi:hypothetical protein